MASMAAEPFCDPRTCTCSKTWPCKNNGRSKQVVFLVLGHYQRVSGQIQQKAGYGPDDRVARETIVGEPAVVVDRLRGTQGVRRVQEDQRQNQHARRRTARVSIRVGGDQQQNQHARRRTARVSFRVG